MITSNGGLELIKKFEGLKLQAYKCPAGKLTIGYGHTRDVEAGMNITKEMADILLKIDLTKIEITINNNVKVPLTQNQFDALASFIFNVGEGNFSRSTLLKKLNAGDYAAAAEEFLRWDKVRERGQLKKLEGLKRRREAERKMFLDIS